MLRIYLVSLPNDIDKISGFTLSREQFTEIY